jgi:DNA/RNA endonuclease YhcR with UshA esterase domain
MTSLNPDKHGHVSTLMGLSRAEVLASHRSGDAGSGSGSQRSYRRRESTKVKPMDDRRATWTEGPSKPQSETTPWVVCGVITTGLIAMMVGWVVFWSAVGAEEPKAAAPPPTAPSGPTPEELEAKAALVVVSSRSAIPEAGEKVKLIPATVLDSDGLGAPSIEKAPAEVIETPRGVIAWDEAGKYVGKEVVVEGTIIDTKNTGPVCLLQFSRGKDGFYLAVFDKAMNAWPEKPEKFFLGKKIQVSGKVVTYRDRPQIKIESAAQVKVVDTTKPGAPTASAPVVAAPAAIVNVPTIAWSQASRCIGQVMTVEGVIIDASESQSKSVFLNFSKDKDAFYAVIMEGRLGAFAASPLDLYRGKKVRVTGRITTYKDRPQIRLESPAQIVVVE